MPKREMLINYNPGQECRIAVVEDGQIEELYQERASAESHVGNIYKGKIVHIERSIQAAFVDFGLERNGFLHISDLHPMYFGGDAKEESERIGHKTPHRHRPPIQSCLRRGQDVLVQVLKEGIGSKGPTLTSYLSIPGRFLVMLPYMERLGVSRKVDDDDARHKVRTMLDELAPPKEFGFIIRTAGIDRTKADLKRDLAYLLRLWKMIDSRMKSTPGVGELYAEADLIIRTIRDVFSTDIERIVVDHDEAARRVKNFLAIASPRSSSQVVTYSSPIPLFNHYDIERQIEYIHSRVVPLPSGGSLVIDSTEALVAIDVNSGKSREARDAETNAFKTNKEAADEVCRQLRLRDLGGVIVIDMIDMRQAKHRREIEQRIKNHLKNDRARTQTAAISPFGIFEMTRQRMRPSLKRSIYIDCPACHGAGQVKSAESVLLEVMRRLALVLHHEKVTRVDLTISPDVAYQLLNAKRSKLVSLEQRHGKPVTVRVGGGTVDLIQMTAYDTHGGSLDLEAIESAIGATPPKITQTSVKETPTDLDTPEQSEDEDSDGQAQQPPPTTDSGDEPAPRRRRRRRRRGGSRSANDSSNGSRDDDPPKADASTTEAAAPHPTDAESADGNTNPDGEAESPPKRPRRRRRRGGAKASKSQPQNQDQPTDAAPNDTESAEPQISKPSSRKRRRRRGSGRSKKEATGNTAPETAVAAESSTGQSS